MDCERLRAAVIVGDRCKNARCIFVAVDEDGLPKCSRNQDQEVISRLSTDGGTGCHEFVQVADEELQTARGGCLFPNGMTSTCGMTRVLETIRT